MSETELASSTGARLVGAMALILLVGGATSSALACSEPTPSTRVEQSGASCFVVSPASPYEPSYTPTSSTLVLENSCDVAVTVDCPATEATCTPLDVGAGETVSAPFALRIEDEPAVYTFASEDSVVEGEFALSLFTESGSCGPMCSAAPRDSRRVPIAWATMLVIGVVAIRRASC